ncbi:MULTISPECIES: uracil-DNA glycosylase family protein [unclassified Campylobacter]|uniref:uracil-DNA glycosylase family protein n=1 Tax=unclassified Campylobacter TaxID=2593542 RepID=UPI0016806168|nr:MULTISPECIES: uracil-DNA glycosylase family protein [unclassified Campylobacter]
MIRSLHYLKAMGYDFLDEIKDENIYNLSFDNLRKTASTCSLCQFSKQRKHILMQKTQKNARLFVLTSFGQKSENESGILLNSKQGERLKTLIYENLGLNEENFYFSYLIKCFSSLKVDDFSLQSCLPFSLNEINLIKPKFILCLGYYPFKALGFDDFNSLRGEILSYKNSLIMASFDMDFLEKNPSYQDEFKKDLLKIKGFI